jgi:putative flippase GtrA
MSSADPTARPPQGGVVNDRPARPPQGGSVWGTLGRHQVGAVAATLLDFSVMIVCVQLLGLAPTPATAVGATVGGVTNFLLARAWIFPRHTGHWASQAIRYALVSGGGALLNTLGEHLMHDVARVQYVVARALVSVVVSLLWSFPVQRRFVFRERLGL